MAALLIVLPFVFAVSFYMQFEKMYAGKIYPGVLIDNISFGGKTPIEVEKYYSDKNDVFKNSDIIFTYEDKIATLSATELAAGYDAKLSATQGYLIGRSGNLLSDLYQRFLAKNTKIRLNSILTMNESYIDETINYASSLVDVPAQDALFNFEGGRVKSFKLSKNGLKLNREKTKKEVLGHLHTLATSNGTDIELKKIELPVEILEPEITTEKANDFGIKELIGQGNSKFVGSIPGRVHNVELGASRLNGRLVAPGSTFSFNDALGDVSAATGFQQAYVIKGGRTVLGDGGGVCQVSTTLFRAAMASGLPIVERHAHSYRVSYYEQDTGPGMDATVFAPSVDFKFKNDTPAHILITAETDTVNKTLVFSFYGTSDGRRAEITKPVILSQVPPPPDLFQDDPTLPKDMIKQVDWKAWGAKVNFDYKVTRDGETLIEKSFFTSFQPWQSVYLRGTREG